jgi:hypothetical protein
MKIAVMSNLHLECDAQFANKSDRGSRNPNQLPLLLVIPAKAGIQGQKARSSFPWTPAFAG